MSRCAFSNRRPSCHHVRIMRYNLPLQLWIIKRYSHIVPCVPLQSLPEVDKMDLLSTANHSYPKPYNLYESIKLGLLVGLLLAPW